MVLTKFKSVVVILVLLQVFVFAGWESAYVADLDGDRVIGLGDFAILASFWGQMDPALFEPDITWITVYDQGVSGNEGFYGQMSKYETTNAQYCYFLNDAIASGDITVDGFAVKDLSNNLCYDLSGPNYTAYGATSGAGARINYSDGAFTVDEGFENHPVSYVSWYGAKAFCDYYGWRLPTQWEWQAVADYDGSYEYGCGLTVETGIANISGTTHPHGTMPVGSFGAYGYGMGDMAGNQWEWTASIVSGSYILRGGSWQSFGIGLTVSYKLEGVPFGTASNIGFRVCRNVLRIVPSVEGMSQSEAEAALNDVGLLVGSVSEQFSDTVAAGCVISQSPVAGENAATGSAVDLVISSGPEPEPVPDITWVTISDSGVSGHEGFSGQMSKYETTNAQYCYFLNDAIASGHITVDGSSVKDLSNNICYDLSGPAYTAYGATNGAGAKINYVDGVFTVDAGFENYPVNYVSWNGAKAFCDYYGWRLPTEWEWQAVADYDGSYEYGCGTTIDTAIANYYSTIHPDGVTQVGAFGVYGYGMGDMAGNLWEWTSTIDSGSYILRGGSWQSLDWQCTVAYQSEGIPFGVGNYIGFRACR